MKKLRRFLIYFFAILIGSILLIGKSAFSFVGKPQSHNYSNIIFENVSKDARIIDVAILGAHDAFTSSINGKSLIDPNDSSMNLYANPIIKFMLNGVISRNSKAQHSDTKTLLEHGVRYFDIRLTYVNNTWYTNHGMISTEFKDCLIEILTFLDTTKEFLILDFQHIFIGSGSLNDLIVLLEETTVAGKNIFDYTRYDSSVTPIGDLTYQDVCALSSGVVMVFGSSITHTKIYDRNTCVRSNWHNKSSHQEMITCITNEHEYLTDNFDEYKDIIRINQAQQTPQLLSDIFGTITSWSLLDKANSHNAKLLTDLNLEELFVSMPILMLDYADSKKGNFNQEIIKIINKYNQTL
jgi:hypothetical protein